MDNVRIYQIEKRDYVTEPDTAKNENGHTTTDEQIQWIKKGYYVTDAQNIILVRDNILYEAGNSQLIPNTPNGFPGDPVPDFFEPGQRVSQITLPEENNKRWDMIGNMITQSTSITQARYEEVLVQHLPQIKEYLTAMQEVKSRYERKEKTVLESFERIRSEHALLNTKLTPNFLESLLI